MNGFRDANLGDTYAIFRDTGTNKNVELNYNGSKKFETTGIGVTIIGNTETQTLNVTGVSTFADTISVAETFNTRGILIYISFPNLMTPY